MINLLAFNWYGALIGGSMILCIILCWFLLKYIGYNPDIVFDVALICIPMAIVGARLFYITFDIIGSDGTLSYWLTDWKFLGFQRVDGKLEYKGLEGLAIFGGLIFASLGGLIVAKMYKKRPQKERMTYIQMLDMFFILIILGQIIGRWGNFANQEAYGNLVTDPNLQWFPYAVYIDKHQAYYQATFFYESFFNSIVLCTMIWMYFGKKRSYDGFVFSIYCIGYGLVRGIVEGLRSDSLMLLGLKINQCLALVLVAYGIINIVYHIRQAKLHNKKPFIYVDKSQLNQDYYGYEKTIQFINSQTKNNPQIDPKNDNQNNTSKD